MSVAQCAGLYHFLNLLRERQHSEQICDSSSVLPYCVRHLLLGELKIIEQAPITARLFDRVQVCPLEIFDQREDEHGPIIEFADDRGDLHPTEIDCGPQTVLAGDEFVGVTGSSNGDRLKETTGLQGGFKFS